MDQDQKKRRTLDTARPLITPNIKLYGTITSFLSRILLMSSSDKNSGKSSDRSSNDCSDYKKDRIDWDPDKVVFTFPRMSSSGKNNKRKWLPPLRRISSSSQDSDFAEEQKLTSSRKRRDTDTKIPSFVKYPKLPPSPTYHSSNKLQPSTPEPAEETSFRDLVEENNELRTRIQVFEKIDDQFLEAASAIGEAAFSDPASGYDIEPLRQILRDIDSPAAEGCLVLLEKLAKTWSAFTASRTREAQQALMNEELAETSLKVNNQLGQLEESKKVLERDRAESDKKALSRVTKVQEMEQQIKALVAANKRFKEVQICDKATISGLQIKAERLKNDNYRLGQQEIELNRSLQIRQTALELHKKYRKQNLAGEMVIDRTHENNPPKWPETYDAKNKKAAAGLARVMDNLDKKDLANPFNSLFAGNPFELPDFSTFSDNIAVFSGLLPDPLEPPTLTIDLDNIAGDDPCRDAKRILLATQAKWAEHKENAELKYAEDILKLESELKYMTTKLDDLRKKNLELLASAAMDLEEHKKTVEDIKGFKDYAPLYVTWLDEKRQLEEKIKKLEDEAKKRAGGEQGKAGGGDVGGAKGESIENLQTQVTVLKAKLADMDSCDEVRKQLEQMKKEKKELEKRLSDPDPNALNGDDALRKIIKLQNRIIELENQLDMGTRDGDFQTELTKALAKQKVRYIKRINILHRRKQEEMFTISGSLELTKNLTLGDILRQDGPPIKEYNDAWFAEQWNELYIRVLILCNINYCGRSDHVPYDYTASAAKDELLSYYLRDIILSERTMHDRINESTKIGETTYRANTATAVIFRILIEEIFEPVRFLLNLQFQDPTQRWKTKLQYRQAFEEFERDPRAATRKGFQTRSSWCTRKAVENGIAEYHPKRRKAADFDYLREFENKSFEGENDTDALIFNTVRAKMILAMFQSLDDDILHDKFQELRADVSTLIRDTLIPLRLPRTGKSPAGEKEAWGGPSLKFAVEEILKFAFNLAVTMRSQRRIIYASTEPEVASMISFKMDTMTNVEQSESNTHSQRDAHDYRTQIEADRFEADEMNPVGKVQVVVQPALWRKGCEYGDFSASNVQVLSKAKVIVRTGFALPT